MTRGKGRTFYFLCSLAILMIAAGLRLWDLGGVPPGLCHDEVAHWLIDRDILAGRHAIYFTEAYGHEPLYHYLQAATVALFGDNWVGLRWPSAAAGLLGLAATTALTRRLFGRTVALLSAAYLAVGFWPLFYARVGLRAIGLPLTAALGVWFLFDAIRGAVGQRATNRGALNRIPAEVGLGLGLGLSSYVYMAARALPFILVAFLAYLALFHRRHVQWRPLLLGLLLAALVAAPLMAWLAAHPGAETRVAEVREPLDRLLAGDFGPVWANLKANLGMFTLRGDPWPRQNVPGRPIFPDPLNGLLFYLGVGLALFRWRDPRYGFLLIWLGGSLIPSLVTSVAPSSIRDILALVVVFAFPAIALKQIADWLLPTLRRSARGVILPQVPKPAGGFSERVSAGRLLLFALPVCLFGLTSLRDYFVRWPADDVVRFDYQTALTAAAHRVDALGLQTPVVVAGLSVDTMDRPGITLAARGPTSHVRLCDTREALVIPASGGRLLVPQVVPFDPILRQRLLDWGGEEVAAPSPEFTEYRLPPAAAVEQALRSAPATLPDGTPIPLPASFDGHLAFVGAVEVGGEPVVGGEITLLTAWRVETPPDAPLKVFLHLLDSSGQLRTQDDGLSSPPQGWAPGDLLLQLHVLDLSALEPGTYTPEVGLYWQPEGPRLAVASSDRLLLPPIVVEEP